MGSIFAVPIYQAESKEFLDWLPQWRAGLSMQCLGEEKKIKSGAVIATALQGAVDFREYHHDPRQPYLLLMGNEQAGLSPELRQAADHVVKLPMIGRADSLNLAVSTGICLYALEHLIGNKYS